MIFNLPESEDKEADSDKVQDLLNYVDSEEVLDYLTTDDMTRLGKFNENNQRPRPIKLISNDSDTKWRFLKKASKLKNSEEFSKVGLSLDKTTKERKEDMILREKLKVEKGKRPDEDLVIFRKEIMSRDKIPEFIKAQRALTATATTNRVASADRV